MVKVKMSRTELSTNRAIQSRFILAQHRHPTHSPSRSDRALAGEPEDWSEPFWTDSPTLCDASDACAMAHERRDDPKSSASSSHRSRHAPADMDEEVDSEQQRLYEERRYDSMYKLLYPRADRLRPVSKIWDDQDRLAKKLVQDGLPDIVRATPNNLVSSLLYQADGKPGRPSLRPKLWKLVLGVEDLGVQDYLSYVSRGPSAVSSKSESRFVVIPQPGHMLNQSVRNDTFRTLATDKQFKGKVNEEMLIRLLDAFVWKNEGAHYLLNRLALR